MKTGVWLYQVGRFRVEHLPYRYLTSSVDLSAPAKGLLHTTQGPTLEGALAVFQQHYAPNFTVGPDARGRVRVLQHAPLGIMGHALVNAAGGVETNRLVRAQIELVGYSIFTRPWLPDGDTRDALFALMHVLERYAEIPPRHVDVRRDPDAWLRATGWVGHVDAPENDHTDPGLFNYTAAFALMRRRWPTAQAGSRPRRTDRARTLPLRARARKAAPVSCHTSALA